MGNRTSRQRRQEEQAQALQTASSPAAHAGGGGGAPPIPQSSHYAQYPTPQPGRPPVPPQHHPSAPYPPVPVNNGQYYGGLTPWHPNAAGGALYGTQRPPYPPPQFPNQRYYPQGPPQPPPSGPQPTTGPFARPPPLPPTQELTQTATIRNAVNLKKQSLSVVSLPDDPNKLAIRFTFDASAPCMVSTFVLAQEDAQNNSRLEATGHAVAPAIRYDRGLAHHFPPADDDSIPNDAAGDLSDNLGGGDVDQQHVVDLTRCGADPKACLAGPSGDVYPLIIRLETITEKGIKAGHTLDELVCGAAQQSWVQSQTTFAALVWEPAPSQRDTAAANGGSSRPEGGSTAVGGGAAGGGRGTWSVRVLKQKIWVEGVSYELQEIYGLEQAAGRSSGGGGGRTDDLGGDDERMCVICLVTPRDTTVLPCRHLCLCHMCAQEWRRQSSKCPICRVNVESLLRIRMKERERGPTTTDTA